MKRLRSKFQHRKSISIANHGTLTLGISGAFVLQALCSSTDPELVTAQDLLQSRDNRDPMTFSKLPICIYMLVDVNENSPYVTWHIQRDQFSTLFVLVRARQRSPDRATKQKQIAIQRVWSESPVVCILSLSITELLVSRVVGTAESSRVIVLGLLHHTPSRLALVDPCSK